MVKKNNSLEITSAVALGVLVLALPVAMMLVQTKQDTRNLASGGCVEMCPHPKDKTLLYTCNPPDTDGTADIKGCGWKVSMCGNSCYECLSASSGWVKQNNLTKCNALLTPSPSPTLIPTSTPAVTNTPTIQPTQTPTLTPTVPVGTDSYLKFKFSFKGILEAYGCADGEKMPLTITVRSADGATKTYSKIIPVKEAVSEADGLAVYRAGLKLDGFTYRNNVMVFIKGPKHLQVKYGKNYQTSFYNQAGGELSGLTNDPNTTPTFDFTGYPLLAGDVTGETDGTPDGVIDGLDFSYIKTAAAKRTTTDEHEYMQADLNGNCAMESSDLTLMMLSLSDRQSQTY